MTVSYRAMTLAFLAVAFAPRGLQAQVEGAVALAVGRRAPEATVRDLEGNPVQLLDVVAKGKPAVLEFWATWCNECKELQTQMDRVQAEMGSDVNVVAVAVGVGQTPRRIKRHLEANDPGYPYVFDERGEAVRAYEIVTTSVVVILDRDGTVVYSGHGAHQDLVGEVRDVLIRTD